MRTKPDYLGQVGKRRRLAAICGVAIATLLFLPAFLIALATLIFNRPVGAEQVQKLIGQTVVGGFFAGASLWILLRLLARKRANNGLTVMPLWFIEIFGVLFLIALLALSIVERSPLLFFFPALSVAGAMIFVRRRVRAKLQPTVEYNSSKHIETFTRGDEGPRKTE